MADLALAIATPVATSLAAATLTATPAKGAAAATTTDPFAILMAASAPAAPVNLAGKLPAAALPAAGKTGDTPLSEIAEKTGDDNGAKDDSDAGSNPDALLALLTNPAPTAVPVVPQAVPTITPAPVNLPVRDGTDPTPTAKPTVAALMTTALPAKPATPALATAPIALAPTATGDSAPAAPTTQTSIHALVQMMTAQADSAPVQQQVAAQLAADTKSDQTVDAAPQVAVSADAAPANGETAKPVAVATPISQTLRMIAPKLDRTSVVAAKTDSKAGATTAKTDTRAPKAQATQETASRATSTRTESTPQAQAPQQAADAPARDTVVTAKAATSLGSVDSVVTRHLAVARDGQWLDSLAKDIAATGGNNSNLSFTLSPEHLGSLKVDILSGSDGASVHMTTDNDTARNIILDAQPRLAAEARAQGLTLKETSVSTNSDPQRQSHSQAQAFAQSSGQQPGGQDRRAYAPVAPLASSPPLSTAADEESDGDLYA